MASPVLAKVDTARVVAMDGAKQLREAIRSIWHYYQVHMIRHETVGPHGYARLCLRLCQQFQIGAIIVIAEERLHPPIAALSNMVGVTRNNQSRHPCHDQGSLCHP